jgi:RNA polymerase I-specific transcription initiation factor RRN5
METEDPEASQPHFPIPDEDSGSAYEESDIEEPGSSQEEEEPKVTRSRARSATRRGRSQIGSWKTRDPSPYRDSSESDRSKSQDSSTESQEEERRRAATEWATTFQEPASPTDIKSPTRRTQSKRKAGKPPSQIRAKRLKSWYNSEYRKLLNVDIHDVVAKSVDEYQEPLETSQIGSSIWTAEEKALFFSSLSSLGRDNVREIASRIETKSEVQVQEYIQLLHEGMMEMSNKLLAVTDLPAAIDISEECCGVLERAGDALASRQERVEEEVEEGKWDELWLLNSEANRRLKRELDRKEVEGTLPAVNMFVLGNWLELSRRVFMNSNCEEENWESIAEPEETPAIRATAFEDFHSLAVSVLKRLISATLFCTMSRQRAMGSNIIKHADINEDDVEAATKILGLKINSNDFWTQCARRCNLKVFDEEWSSFMSYEEAEKSLRENRRERSRSRSVSRRARSVSRAQSEVYQEDHIHLESLSDDDSVLGHESDYISSASASDDELTDYLTEGEAMSSKSRKDRLLQKAKAKKDAERAQEAYVEAFDNEQSHFEEQRLWTLLGQTAPFELKSEPTDLPDPPKGNFRDDMGQGNWRNYLEFRSQWETLETPVPKASFDGNREKVSKRAEKRAEGARVGQDVDFADSEDVELAVQSNEDGNEQVGQEVAVEEEDDEEEGHFPNQQVLEEARIDSDEQGNEAYDSAQDHFEDQDEDQVHDDYVDADEVEHDFQDGNQAEHQYPASASPMSKDTRNFQDADDDMKIKSEYDSSE